MHAASVDPEPGSNSPERMHSLAAATSSEGLTARTSVFSGSLPLYSCQGAASSEAREGVRRRPRSMGPGSTCIRRAGGPAGGLENPRLHDQKDECAGDPRLERELDGARRAERTGEDEIDHEAEQAGHQHLRQPEADLDRELLDPEPERHGLGPTLGRAFAERPAALEGAD